LGDHDEQSLCEEGSHTLTWLDEIKLLYLPGVAGLPLLFLHARVLVPDLGLVLDPELGGV